MRYKKYHPAKKLRDFVECYFVWEGESRNPVSFESPPSALCSMVFNFCEPYAISNHKYKKHEVPVSFISGQALKNYTLHLQGKIGMVGAVLKPTAIFNFYNIPMYGFAGERIPFSQVDSECSRTIERQIISVNNALDRVALIEEYLLKLLSSTNYATKKITAVANLIYDEKGQLNILDIMESVPMSRRTFERRFLNEVGLSPKAYAKIRRFGHTCLLMAGKRNVNLMDVLYEGGYYDQSHFIKDFKYFSGRTPKTYVDTNEELANYVDQVSIVERRLLDGN